MLQWRHVTLPGKEPTEFTYTRMLRLLQQA
jgi:hypothetical protein